MAASRSISRLFWTSSKRLLRPEGHVRTNHLQGLRTLASQQRTYASESKGHQLTVREALNDALAEEMVRNENVFILGTLSFVPRTLKAKHPL